MCEVRIERDATLAPGRASWFEMPSELLIVVSAAGVTDEGAECLEEAWRHFIRRGLWRWKEPGGLPLDVVYARVVLPEGIAVRVTSSPGLVGCHVSPDHFTSEAARALQRVARECARNGWAQHAPFPQQAGSLVAREVA